MSGQGGAILAGFNQGKIANCHATGTVDGGTCGSNVGGLAGSNQGLISRSYANVFVTGRGIYSFGFLLGYNCG